MSELATSVIGAPVAENGRPSVSVVLPFAGDADAAQAAIRQLASLTLSSGDELIVVDNSGCDGVVPDVRDVRVVRAWSESSSYYARNEGAVAARNPWLLFVDSDCQLPPDLLERYFAEPIGADVGAVVGEVEGVPDQSALVSRYARSRGHLTQRLHWESEFRPWGVTANLLVRREAWASVGGFQEGVRSGGDAEFSWRLQDAGWRLDYRPSAFVWHEHRDTLRRLVRQAARYGAGRAWLMRRYPQGHRRPVLVREVLRSLAGIVVWSIAGQFERAAFKGLDGLYVTSEWLAFWLASNAPSRADPSHGARIGLVADAFPEAGAAAPVEDAHVEALGRPIRRDLKLARELDIAYREDDGGIDRIRSCAWLIRAAPAFALRHPVKALRLAPAARRMKQRGVEEIRSLDASDAPVAGPLLAEVLGVPFVANGTS